MRVAALTFLLVATLSCSSCATGQRGDSTQGSMRAKSRDIFSAGTTTLHVDSGEGPVIGVVRGPVVFQLVKFGAEFSEVTVPALTPHLFVKSSELSMELAPEETVERGGPTTAPIAIESISVPFRATPHGRVLMSTVAARLEIERHGDGFVAVTMREHVLGDPARPHNAELHVFVDDEDLRAAFLRSGQERMFVVRTDAAAGDAVVMQAVGALAADGIEPVRASPRALREGDRFYLPSINGAQLGSAGGALPRRAASKPHCQEWRVQDVRAAATPPAKGADREIVNQVATLYADEGEGSEVVHLEYPMSLQDRAIGLTGPRFRRPGLPDNELLCLSGYSVVDARPEQWTLIDGDAANIVGYPAGISDVSSWYLARAACEAALSHDKPELIGCAD